MQVFWDYFFMLQVFVFLVKVSGYFYLQYTRNILIEQIDILAK